MRLDAQVFVALTDDEVGRARANGIARQVRRYLLGHRHRNNWDVSYEEACEIGARSACGEYAAQTLFPFLKWHDEIVDDPSGLPDIGDFIEVRTPGQKIGERWRSLLGYINNPVPEDWAVILVLPYYTNVFWIVGWVWGRELNAAPIAEFQPGRRHHHLPPTIPPLRHMQHLIDIAWERASEDPPHRAR